MTPQEQEQCFRDLRKRFPTWEPKFVSGYIHGLEDSHHRQQPNAEFVCGRKKTDYAMGYLLGFAIGFGEDAALSPWFRTIGHLVEETRRGQAEGHD